ncbi:hypothetical protein [Pseudarthrobacter sulfonivorans]|uniref:hypothetical protein n=1 Tax=Pseudarthrobacter sulfonivorans TaxID=121292 RepID=UPI00285AAA4B|nr:hypothetical protein [Pseudarthrobacter sulfonivorans]MDR6417704.1 hypothetical protein [Pseudarthrobacter sulfonivorans]
METTRLAGDAAIDRFRAPQHVEDWTLLDGRDIEICEQGQVTDRGRVDAITKDGTILWLAQDGARPRRLIEQIPGRSVTDVTAD